MGNCVRKNISVLKKTIRHAFMFKSCFVAVYAMLDECSQATFIKESVLQSFESVPHRDATVGIETLNSSQMSHCFAADGFQIKAIPQYERFYHSTSLPLPTVFSQPDFPVDVNEIASRATVSQWPHLQRIKDFMLPEDCNIPVGLLIGTDCSEALQPYEVIPKDCDGPYASRALLGWCVVGPMSRKSKVS